MSDDHRPTVLSLFAGIGGFDLALERVGFRCAGQVEIDVFCQRILAARFPHAPRWADCREFAGDGLESPLDLLVGGFPCQDLSVAGQRAGLGGTRSALFYEIVRIAKILRPAWGLVENVPGLLISAGGRDMGLVLQGLRECWPAVGYRVLDSRYFGVPQRRRRVFFVCGPDEARVTQVLFESEGGGGDSAPGQEAGARVAASLSMGTGPTSSGGRRREDDVNLVFTMQRFHEFAETDGAAPPVKGRDGSRGMPNLVASAVAYQQHGTNVGEMGTLRRGDGGVTSGVPFVTHALSAEGADASEDGTGRGTPIIPIQYAEQRGRDKRQNGIGIGQEGDPSFTPDASYPHGIAAPSSVRRLTPTECARLQSFPDGWCCLCQPLDVWAVDPETAAERCCCPDSPQYRAYGNAVTVNVGEWISRRLYRTINAA